MTVNNNDINVYFHMRNHYRKLSNVRSKIDTSPPKVFRKLESSSQAETTVGKVSFQCKELPLGKNICPLAGQQYNVKGRILSHTCVNKRSPRKPANVRSSSVPRPQNKLGPYEASTKLRKTKSQSLQAVREDWKSGATRTKRTKQTRCYPNVPLLQNIDKDMPPSSRRENSEGSSSRTQTTDSSRSSVVTSRKSGRSSRSKEDQQGIWGFTQSRQINIWGHTFQPVENLHVRSRTDEHEYLQFLLRITEDVIMNNYFKNEDIQRVFKSHMEANRGRLQMTPFSNMAMRAAKIQGGKVKIWKEHNEIYKIAHSQNSWKTFQEKMELQLIRLSKELNIPYTPTSPSIVEKDATDSPKLPGSPINTEKLGDCECATKRNLQLIHFPNRYLPYEDNIFASNLENILVNRHSLGRVTECTEPTNSLDTIYNANNRFSAMTVASSIGVDSLAPSNEQDGNDPGDKSDGSYNDGSSLTDKEKIGSIEEDILFNKLHSRSLPILSKKHASLQTDVLVPNVATPQVKVDNVDSSTRSDVSNKTVISRDSLTPEVVSSTNFDDIPLDEKSTNIELPRDERKHIDQDTQGKLIVPSAESPGIRDSLLNVTKMQQTKQQKKEKCTQIMIEHLEKECNTNKDVKIIEKDDDYVLINKPIYVLRNIVESKDGLVYFTEQSTSKEDIVEEPGAENPVELTEDECKTTVFENPSDTEICIHEPNLSDYSIKAESLEKDYLYNNYSRLLNSDYDLTPQRDSDVDSKYHYLMLDVATSISNVNLPTKSDLLLTDNYVLRSDLSNESNHLLGGGKEYCISDDGQYEIRSYNMNNVFPPRSANNTKDRHFLQGSEVAKKISQLSISLSNYEIGSEISMGQYYDENSESESGLYPLAFDIPVRK